MVTIVTADAPTPQAWTAAAVVGAEEAGGVPAEEGAAAAAAAEGGVGEEEEAEGAEAGEVCCWREVENRFEFGCPHGVS